MNCFPKLPVVIVLDVFFFLQNSVSLYINVATICEWCEQMLGIPVLFRGLKLLSYPCEEPLPFVRDFKDFSCVRVNSWTGLIIFPVIFLMKTMLLTDFKVLSVRQKQRWFSKILCCAFLWSGQGFNAWSDKNSSKTTAGSSWWSFLPSYKTRNWK